jgi:hypothetical protein
MERLRRFRKGRTVEDVFWGYVDRRGEDECWPWKLKPHKYQGGAIFSFRGQHYTAPRVAYALANGSELPWKNCGRVGAVGIIVCHRCFNKTCCNPAHLYAGGCDDNQRDADCAILTAANVREIRRMDRVGELWRRGHPVGRPKPADAMTVPDVAMRYGVKPITIYAVLYRRIWASLSD